MLDTLESQYDCSRAGDDIHSLKQELAALKERQSPDKETQETMNRIENQISFIMNKCDIRH